MDSNCHKRLLKFVFFLGVLFLFMGVSFGQDIVLIAHKGVPVDSLSPDEIRNIFLGKAIDWPDHSLIQTVLFSDPEIHQFFVRKYVKKTDRQFDAWWRRKLFEGTGMIPPAYGSAKEILNFVAGTKGCIGYVSSDIPIGDNVKILSVTDK